MPRQLSITMIAAVAKNGVIGRDNEMPWRIPQDMKDFRAYTMGKPCLMGRKTFESLPKPLEGRLNLVMTHDITKPIEGATVVPSLEAAVKIALIDEGHDELCVIGGEEIYRLAMPYANKILMTKIDKDFEGDACFPSFDPHWHADVLIDDRYEYFDTRIEVWTYRRSSDYVFPCTSPEEKAMVFALNFAREQRSLPPLRTRTVQRVQHIHVDSPDTHTR